MRACDIVIAMDELKVFQISELVDYLMEEWDFLGRKTIKTRVESTVYSCLKDRTLVRINKEPPVFALPRYADNWQEYYTGIKTCPVCGTPFLSRRGKQDRYCSRKCYEKAKAKRRREKTRERVKKYLHSADDLAVNKYKEWTERDIEILQKMREEGKTCREIAQKLGRTVYSVRWRLQKLKEVSHAN